jgi:ABC-type sulfate transport system substrate-binding protein
MDINESTDVTIPIRNLIAMVAATSVATMAYFGIQERLNKIEHAFDKSQLEIERNTEFRILWPRGELGSLPDDARQDMMIEGLQIDVVGLRQIEKEVHELTIRIGTIEALWEQEPQ